MKALLAMSLVVLCGCSGGVLEPHGPVGSAERIILFNATVIMLSVVIPVIIATFAFAWWYRVGNKKARRLPNFSYSGRVEFVVWAIPALVVIFLGGIGWIGSHALDPTAPLKSHGQPLEIQVVSLDWKWLFIYPAQGVGSVNQLVIPVGTPLRFRITSSGVMNSFFIPQLGSQIYAMAGMATQVNLQADDAGTFDGLSAQFSGEGFSDMHFAVRALPPAEYEQWLQNARARGEPLDGAAYAALTAPSQRDAPRTFRSVSTGLFEAILASPGAPPKPSTN